MLLILDGNSDIGTHVRSNLYDQICLRHSIRSKAVTIWIFFSEKNYVLLVRTILDSNSDIGAHVRINLYY